MFEVSSMLFEHMIYKILGGNEETNIEGSFACFVQDFRNNEKYQSTPRLPLYASSCVIRWLSIFLLKKRF